MGNLSKGRAISGILFLVLVWGSVWPIYKIALEYTPPILFAGIRSLIGGILFTAILLPNWRKIRWKETWPIYILSSLFNVILFYGVQSIGLQYLPAGLYSVIVYLQPVLVVFLAWIWLKEQLTPLKVAGILLGFLGVVFASLKGITGDISVIGILLALITGVSWAVGTVYVKRTSPQVDGLWLVALQNVLGGIALSGVGVVVEDATAIQWNAAFIACLLYGAIFGVVLAFVVYFTLMNLGDSGRIGSFTFLVPLISVLIGTIFLQEPFTISLAIGMLFILLSIYLINFRKKSTV